MINKYEHRFNISIVSINYDVFYKKDRNVLMDALAKISEIMLDPDLTDCDKLDEIQSIIDSEGY